MNYDIYRFVDFIKAKPWPEMLRAIDAELALRMRWAAETRHAGAIHEGDDSEFKVFLSATLRYLLAEGRLRPKDLSEENFRMLKPVCETLVKQGRFHPDCFSLFVDSFDYMRDGAAPASQSPWQQDKHRA